MLCPALSKVDRFERKEYEEALRLAPQLVQRETPIEDFLWAENFKAHRAALRYVRYWKARKFLFGDRWLLPLDLTGTCPSWANEETSLPLDLR